MNSICVCVCLVYYPLSSSDRVVSGCDRQTACLPWHVGPRCFCLPGPKTVAELLCVLYFKPAAANHTHTRPIPHGRQANCCDKPLDAYPIRLHPKVSHAASNELQSKNSSQPSCCFDLSHLMGGTRTWSCGMTKHNDNAGKETPSPSWGYFHISIKCCVLLLTVSKVCCFLCLISV